MNILIEIITESMVPIVVTLFCFFLTVSTVLIIDIHIDKEHKVDPSFSGILAFCILSLMVSLIVLSYLRYII